MLANNTEREKFSKMLEFIIAHCDELFGPELPDTLPPEDDDIYDSIFHPEHTLKVLFMNKHNMEIKTQNLSPNNLNTVDHPIPLLVGRYWESHIT